MREAISKIIGAGVGFLISLIPAWVGLTEAMSMDLQFSITSVLVVLGYGLTHRYLRANVPALSDKGI